MLFNVKTMLFISLPIRLTSPFRNQNSGIKVSVVHM